MSIPRRLFLQSLGSATVGLTTTPTALPSATDRVAPLAAIDGINPIEHFQQMRQVLIDNDNLFGSRHVIPMVQEQIAIIQQLQSSRNGADGQELCRVQAQYSVLCGGLYHDSGEHHLAESWNDRALALSHLAADHDLTVYILADKARLAGGMRVAVDAIGAGEHASGQSSNSRSMRSHSVRRSAINVSPSTSCARTNHPAGPVICCRAASGLLATLLVG